MRTLSSLVAVITLILTVVFIPMVGGVIFAMVFFGLFLLALVGVLGGVEDRRVRQHNPSLDPTGWRDGSNRPVRSQRSVR
jgi:hypothetical protein